jgi:hypothetical protein
MLPLVNPRGADDVRKQMDMVMTTLRKDKRPKPLCRKQSVYAAIGLFILFALISGEIYDAKVQ